MQVNDFPGKSVDEIGGYEGKEACQHNEVDAEALEQGQRLVGISELCLRDDSRRHSQPLSAHQGVGVGFVVVPDTSALLDCAVPVIAVTRKSYVLPAVRPVTIVIDAPFIL